MSDHLLTDSSFFFSRNFGVNLQASSGSFISLGNGQNFSLALSQGELHLPSSDTVVNAAFSLGFPQVLAFATACMGLYFGIKLLRSFTP